MKKTEPAVLISFSLFFHFFDQKGHNFDHFFQKFWKKSFCPKHSDFDGKLSGESIFFGLMVVKNCVFFRLRTFFIKLAKRSFCTTTKKGKNRTMIFKTILKNFFSAKTQWFLLQIEWGIHFFWSHGSEKSTFFRIWTFSWLSALIFYFFEQNSHIFTYF